MSSIKYILIQFSYLPEGHSERLYYSLIKKNSVYQLCRCGEQYFQYFEGRVKLNCAWAYPKTQNRKKSEGSGKLTIRI